MTLLLLVRHAETEGMAGKKDSDHLSSRGRRQARLVAKRLAEFEFDRIYTSDAIRALETTKLIMAERSGKKFTVTPQLREIYAPIVGGVPTTYSPKREPKERVRAERVFRRFCRPGRKRILLVCHGNLIRFLIARTLKVNPKHLPCPFRILPTSVSTLVFERNLSGVRSVNDVSHLPAALARD